MDTEAKSILYGNTPGRGELAADKLGGVKRVISVLEQMNTYMNFAGAVSLSADYAFKCTMYGWGYDSPEELRKYFQRLEAEGYLEPSAYQEQHSGDDIWYKMTHHSIDLLKSQSSSFLDWAKRPDQPPERR